MTLRRFEGLRVHDVRLHPVLLRVSAAQISMKWRQWPNDAGPGAPRLGSKQRGQIRLPESGPAECPGRGESGPRRSARSRTWGPLVWKVPIARNVPGYEGA